MMDWSGELAANKLRSSNKEYSLTHLRDWFLFFIEIMLLKLIKQNEGSINGSLNKQITMAKRFRWLVHIVKFFCLSEFFESIKSWHRW